MGSSQQFSFRNFAFEAKHLLKVENMADEIYGNDERIEALWAIKAMEHAEVYFNILCSVDPKEIKRLSQNDDEIYEKFRKDFPDLNVANLEEMKDLKSTEMKAKWREFCNTHTSQLKPRLRGSKFCDCHQDSILCY